MIRFTLDQLREKAKIRPVEYFEDVLSLATVDGQDVTLDQSAYTQLTAKYRGSSPSPAPDEPSAADLLVNFSSAVAQWSAAGFPVATRQTFEERSAVCSACEFWDGSARLGLGKCKHKKCGCTRFKRWLASERCPLGKWSD